jgi:hypothetical protein
MLPALIAHLSEQFVGSLPRIFAARTLLSGIDAPQSIALFF